MDALTTGLSEVKRLVALPAVDQPRVFDVAARSLHTGLKLHSCLVFLQEAHSALYAAIVGIGPLFDEIRQQPVIDPGHKDVFTVCLARGEDILIQDPDDPRISPFIPDWFKRVSHHGPFVLLPVKDAAGTFAILCGTVKKPARIDLGAIRVQPVKNLRAVLKTLRDAAQPRRAAA